MKETKDNSGGNIDLSASLQADRKIRYGLSALDKTQREQEEQASRNGFNTIAVNSSIDS
ncbi:hypothetical protein [Photobacterium lutimaris]|uniref:hypothetical protein n=1 Tax=Photobacterium lutimaris TaxID=388278 RepID=UPI001414E77A|nr:hypothetical protein [Photobacterium lutimaris]